MNCLIVDDDQFIREILTEFVKQTKSLNLIKACKDGIEARNILMEEKVDLMLLDIEMPVLTGINLLKSLTHTPLIILISAHVEYAIEAFEYDVLDFIVKPFDYPRFLKAIAKAEQKIKNDQINLPSEPSTIFVKVDKKIIQLNYIDICFLEAYGNYVKIHTADDVHVHHASLREIGEKLPSKEFIQVHRSFIIRIDKINEIESDIIKINNHAIPIGKNYKKELNTILNWL